MNALQRVLEGVFRRKYPEAEVNFDSRSSEHELQASILHTSSVRVSTTLLAEAKGDVLQQISEDTIESLKQDLQMTLSILSDKKRVLENLKLINNSDREGIYYASEILLRYINDVDIRRAFYKAVRR